MKANPLGQILKERELTREDLRFMAGVSPITIRLIERHGYRPGREVRERITKALGVGEEAIWPAGRENRNG